MHKTLAGFLAVTVMALAAERVVAQVGTDQDIKIRGVRASDVVTLEILNHHEFPNPPWAGWAGHKYTVHVLDNTEVDVDAVVHHRFDPAGMQFPEIYTNPFGPRSNNEVSHPIEWKAPHPFAFQSGIDVQPTQVFRLADLQLHVKGTTIGQNSDTDLEVRVWNMWHVRQDSVIVPMQPSDRVWVPSPFTNIQQLHRPDSVYEIPQGIPYPELSSPDGHWLHVQEPIPFHFWASQYYATLVDTITIGIEHIPEPATMALTGFGVICAVMGLRSHWKRRG
jgi:hypothetical protein